MDRATRERRTPRRMFAVLATLGLVAGMLGVLAPAASAATYNVTNLNDSGSGSLRQAILDANANAGADIITFKSGLTGSITLASTLPMITDSAGLTITGPGASNLTISGKGSMQVFAKYSGALYLSGVTIASGAASGGSGGGIYNGSGTLTITNSTFSGNSAPGGGAGGGIYNDYYGALTITNSTFSGNSATDGGGGILNDGTLTITNSTFSGNSAPGGGGIANLSDGAVTITNSTFTGNTANNDLGTGAGIYSRGTLTVTSSTFSDNSALEGGGIFNWGGALTVTNSTFSGNSATGTDPNSYFGGGAIDSSGSVTVTNSTFSGNSAATAGADFQIYSGPTVTLKSTILGSSGGSNCFVYDTGTFVDGGYNISKDASCNLSSANNSQPSTDPSLGALANNGGPTQTMLPGAPAIDQIPAGTNGCGTTITTDQRGIARPQNSLCDIGAVEVVPPYTFNGFFSPVDNPTVLNTAKAGQAIPVKWMLTDDSGNPITDPASFVRLTSVQEDCASLDNTGTDAVEAYVGGSGLQNLGGGNWQFNWATPKSYAGTCREMRLQLVDGSVHTAEFKFTK